MDSEQQQRCDAPTARIIAERTSPECHVFFDLLAQLTHAEARHVWKAAHAAARRMLNRKTDDHMPQIANDDDNEDGRNGDDGRDHHEPDVDRDRQSEADSDSGADDCCTDDSDGSDDSEDTDDSDDSGEALRQPARRQPAPLEAVDSLAVVTLAALVSADKFDATSATALANTPGAVEALLQTISTTRRETDPEVAAALRALKAIADTSQQVLLHRHGAVAVLLGLLKRGWANYDQRQNMETMKGVMDLLRNLWRTEAPTSQAQCLEVVTVLTPWVQIGYNLWAMGNDSMRAVAVDMVADVVLTPEDASAREQHRDDSALPPLSPESVARIAAMGDVAAVFEGPFWRSENIVATARLLCRLLPMTDAQWAKVDFGSILVGQVILQPRDNAVAIAALLRTLTATDRADELFIGPPAVCNALRWFANFMDGSDAELRAETFLVLRNILVNCREEYCETIICSSAFASVVASVLAGKGGEVVVKAALERRPAAVFDMVTADILDRLAPTERQRILRAVAGIDQLTVTEPTIVYAAYGHARAQSRSVLAAVRHARSTGMIPADKIAFGDPCPEEHKVLRVIIAVAAEVEGSPARLIERSAPQGGSVDVRDLFVPVEQGGEDLVTIMHATYAMSNQDRYPTDCTQAVRAEVKWRGNSIAVAAHLGGHGPIHGSRRHSETGVLRVTFMLPGQSTKVTLSVPEGEILQFSELTVPGPRPKIVAAGYGENPFCVTQDGCYRRVCWVGDVAVAQKWFDSTGGVPATSVVFGNPDIYSEGSKILKLQVLMPDGRVIAESRREGYTFKLRR
jgi:hypothetical protein